MVHLKVKRLCVGSLDHSDIASCPLVCLCQRVGPPVRPVNLSTVHSDGEGMRQILMPSQNLDQPRTIILGWINGIRPADSTNIVLYVHKIKVFVWVCSCLCPLALTWHRSRGCGAPDNPLWVHLASLHCRFPYGWSSCLLRSWMQLQSWASWHPSLSRRGSCNATKWTCSYQTTRSRISVQSQPHNYQNICPLFDISRRHSEHTRPEDRGRWLEGAPPLQPAAWSSWCRPTWPPLSDPGCFPPSKCFLLSSPLPSPQE